jgi:hypothetical protein
MPNRLSRRPTAPALARHLLVALLALALLATACSDAHTQAQRDLADPGVDPDVVTVLATTDLIPLLKALNQAFLLVRPNTTLVFVNQITDQSGRHRKVNSKLSNTQLVQSGAAPSLWIDAPDKLAPFANDPRAQGPVLPFAVESMVVVVQQGNPAHVSGLDAFAAGGVPAGRCKSDVACGKPAQEWLAAAKVRGVFPLVTNDAPSLIAAIAKGQVQVGIVWARDLPPDTPGVSTVPVATPPSPATPYSMLGMNPNPTAKQFEQWLATSPAARAVITSYGFLPGNGT